MKPVRTQQNVIDLNVADAGEYADVTVRLPKHMTKDLVDHVSKNPSLPLRSW